MELQLENVTLTASLGTETLLEDISFEVDRGDRVALVGPSGAGKSLLLRLLNRLSDPSRGTVRFRDRDIREIPVLELRRQIILVLQESKLLEMTVAEAIAYPLQLRGTSKPQIQQRVDTWCQRLHIPSDWMGKTELQLSVGQRQLVAIARALVTEPAVLLLDEPTSALDVGRTHTLLQVLADMASQLEIAIIMANHQLDTAKSFANRLLYLERGKLSQDLDAATADWDEIHRRLLEAERQVAKEWDDETMG
ncbi:ABC transporter ATP-binding protein [Baaleninema simplex]|uniref:ABC transporter ATP-binding protein n=1 Tax=Baaleninema simplex TaxID=2862350 RepID=UPI00034638AD|nr:ATP-binding cassette domain-containing protein [Baaleninema simplex]